MFSKSWQLLHDHSKKTFEVCGQSENTDPFMNSVHGMQKAGMNVSGAIHPVSNKNSNKESFKVVGYSKEEGLYQRLMKEYKDRIMKSAEEWD